MAIKKILEGHKSVVCIIFGNLEKNCLKLDNGFQTYISYDNI